MAIELTYLGWSAFLFTSKAGTRLIIDPFLSGYPEHHLPPSPISVDALGPVDIVAVTHAAGDHMGDTFKIMHKSDACLACGIDVLQHAHKAGFGDERVALMVSGTELRHKDLTIKAVGARHISWTIFDGHPMTGQPMCYFVKSDEGYTVFHGGDTSITYDLRLYGELYRPDIALLGVGGAIIGGRPLVELDPSEAALAAEFLGVKVAIPMHYLEHEVAVRFVQQLALRAPKAKGIIMKAGDTFRFKG
jgi:L-ascorbate metabolism protein UlaG (beta-lactamase superfamily)